MLSSPDLASVGGRLGMRPHEGGVSQAEAGAQVLVSTLEFHSPAAVVTGMG